MDERSEFPLVMAAGQQRHAAQVSANVRARVLSPGPLSPDETAYVRWLQEHAAELYARARWLVEAAEREAIGGCQ